MNEFDNVEDVIRRKRLIRDPFSGKLFDAPTYTPVVETDPNLKPLGKYDRGVHSAAHQDAVRAGNQSGWEAWANTGAQVLSEVGLGTLEGVGYLLDFEQHAKILAGTEQDYSNWFSDLMRAGKESVSEAMPVHGGEGFQPLNGRWWAKNMPSIFSTLMLAVPSAGAVKLTGMALKGMGAGKRFAQLGKLAESGNPQAVKLFQEAQLAMNKRKGLAGSLFSRYMENTMEATEVMQSEYNRLIEGGMSEEEARELAGQAASNAWYANLVNLATDIPQYQMLFGGFKNLAKEGAKKTGRLSSIGNLLKVSASEALEEGVQYGIQQEAPRSGNALETLSNVAKNSPQYVEDPEFWTSITLGAVGGALFSGAAGQAAKSLGEKPVKRLYERLGKMQEALRKGDEATAKKLRDEEIADMAMEDPDGLGNLIDHAKGENPIEAGEVEAVRDFTEETLQSFADDPLQIDKTKVAVQQKSAEESAFKAEQKLQELVGQPTNRLEAHDTIQGEINAYDNMLSSMKKNDPQRVYVEEARKDAYERMKQLNPEYDSSKRGPKINAGADGIKFEKEAKQLAASRVESVKAKHLMDKLNSDPQEAIQQKLAEEETKRTEEFNRELSKVTHPAELSEIEKKNPDKDTSTFRQKKLNEEFQVITALAEEILEREDAPADKEGLWNEVMKADLPWTKDEPAVNKTKLDKYWNEKAGITGYITGDVIEITNPETKEKKTLRVEEINTKDNTATVSDIVSQGEWVIDKDTLDGFTPTVIPQEVTDPVSLEDPEPVGVAEQPKPVKKTESEEIVPTQETSIPVEGKTVKVEQFEVTKTGDKYYYKNGEEVTDDKTINKTEVKLNYDKNRIVEHNGTKYFILPDEKIISLGQSTKGAERFKSGPQREKILKKYRDKVETPVTEQSPEKSHSSEQKVWVGAIEVTKKDGQYFYRNGEEITDNKIINSAEVELNYDENRVVEHNNVKYFVLPDDRIISLGNRTKGTEKFKTGNQRTSILEKVERQLEGKEKVEEKLPLNVIARKLREEVLEDEIAVAFAQGTRVAEEDVNRWGDPNWIKDNPAIRLHFTKKRQKGGKDVADWAASLSEKWGLDEKDVIESIMSFLKEGGTGEYLRRRYEEQQEGLFIGGELDPDESSVLETTSETPPAPDIVPKNVPAGVYKEEDFREGEIVYEPQEHGEGMTGHLYDVQLNTITVQRSNGTSVTAWTVARDEAGHPVPGFTPHLEGPNLKVSKEEALHRTRNFYKYFDQNDPVHLEIDMDVPYNRNTGTSWENAAVIAVMYDKDGNRIPIAAIPSAAKFRGANRVAFEALRKELWDKAQKAGSGIVRADNTVQIDTIRKGRWWNVPERKSPSQSGYEVILGISDRNGVIQDNEANVDSLNDQGRGIYMAVPTPSGRNIWSKLFIKTLKDSPKHRQQVIDLLEKARQAHLEFKSAQERNIDPIKNIDDFPALKEWRRDFNSIRAAIREIVQFRVEDKKNPGKYKLAPDFRENLFEIKMFHTDGVFDPLKFIEITKMDDHVLHVDMHKINKGDYNQSVDDRLQTDLNYGTAFHSQSFLFTDYPIDVSLKSVKSEERIPADKSGVRRGFKPPEIKFSGGVVETTHDGKVSIDRTIAENISDKEMAGLKEELGVKSDKEVHDKVKDEVTSQLNSKVPNSKNTLFQRIVSRIKNILLGLMVLLQFNVSTSFTVPVSQEAATYEQVNVNNLKDWDNIFMNQEAVNKLGNLSVITNFHKNSDDVYLVVDKKSGMSHLYKGDNLITSYEVGVGKKEGDEQTRTIVRNGKVYWEEGSLTTGAGIYIVNNQGTFLSSPSFTLLNERGVEIPSVMHKTLPGRKKLFKNNNSADNRMSYGCINFEGASIKDLSGRIGKGTKVYVLPDNSSNKFVLKDGKLLFTSSDKDVNRSLFRFTPEPVFFKADNPTQKQKEFLQFSSDIKEDLMSLYPTISNDEYNRIARIAYGIFGQESSFGTYGMGRGQIGRVQDLAGIVAGKNVSVGVAQIRLTSVSDKVKGKFDISETADLLNMKKAVAATVGHLMDIYIDQIPAGRKSEFEQLLPLGYNNPSELRSVLKSGGEVSNAYVRNVSKHSKEVKAFISDNFTKARQKTSGMRFRRPDTIRKNKINIEEAVQWLSRVLPSDISVEVTQGIIRIGGIDAWGVTQDALIRLSKLAEAGTEFHEAFHVVFNNILTPSQRQSILNQARRTYKITPAEISRAQKTIDALAEYNEFWKKENYPITAEELALEERLADEFMDFMQTGKTGLGSRIKSFFTRLKDWIRIALGYGPTIKGVFENLKAGEYRNAPFYSNNYNPRTKRPDGFSLKEISDVVNISMNLFDRVIQNASDDLQSAYRDALSTDRESNKILSTTEPSVLTYLHYYMENDAENPDRDFYLKVFQAFRPDIIDTDLNTEGDPRTGPMYYEMIKEMGNRGINVSFGRNDESLEYNEDEGSKETWQEGQFRISPKEKLTIRLKRILFNIPLMDKNGNSVLDSSGMGLPLYNDGGVLYAKLQSKIGNSWSLEDMVKTLKQEAAYDPVYGYISEMIADYQESFNQNELAVQMYEHIGQNMHPLFKTILQVGMGKGNYHLRAIDTNSFTLRKTILNDLYNTYAFRADDTGRESAVNSFENILGKDDAKKDRRLQESKLFSAVDVDRIAQGLDFIGFNIPRDVIEKANENRDLYRAVKALVTGLKSNEEFGTAYGGRTTKEQSFVKAIAPYYSQDYQDAHLTVAGEKQFEWMKSNYIGKLVSRMNKDYEGIQKKFLNDPPYRHLPYLKNNPEPEFIVLDGFKEDGRSEGKGYTDFNDKEMLATMLSLYHNQGSKRRGAYLLPIPSDSPNLGAVMLPKQQNLSKVTADLLSVAQYEYERMQRNIKDDPDFPWSKEPSFFPELLTGKEKNSMQLLQEMENLIDKKTRELADRLRELGMISMKDGKLIGSELLDSRVDDIHSFLREFTANHMLAHSQLILLTTGDPAFYGSIDNFYKRSKEWWSPGTQATSAAFYQTPDGTVIKVPSVMKTKILPDIEIPSAQIEEIGQVIEDTTPYKKVNWTDGATLLDPVSYRYREIATGRWNDLKQAAWEIIMSGKMLTQEDVVKLRDARNKAIAKAETIEEKAALRKLRIPTRTMFQPIKPYYYDLTVVKNILLPFQKKDAEFLMNPVYGLEIINGVPNPMYNPMYKELLTDMGYSFTKDSVTYSEDTRKTDVFTHKTTMKVAKFGVGKGETLKEQIDSAYSHSLYYDEWRRQQETPEHHFETDDIFSIQLMKLIVSDIDKGAMYGDKTGQQLVNEYQEQLIDDIENAWSELTGRIEVKDDPQGTFDNLVKVIREEVLNRGMGEQYMDALEQTPNQLLETVQNTKLPLWHPIHAYRIEALLNSLFRNGVTKQKFKKGFAFVNAPPAGFKNVPKIVWVNGDPKQGISHFEAYVPIYDKRLYRYINKTTGLVDMDKVRKNEPDLLKGLIYRVPTEDKYSMIHIEVIGFTPDDSGVVYLPPDVLTITGMDFDIDKMRGLFFGTIPEKLEYNKTTEEGKEVIRKFQESLDKLYDEYGDAIKLFRNVKNLQKFLDRRLKKIETLSEVLTEEESQEMVDLLLPEMEKEEALVSQIETLMSSKESKEGDDTDAMKKLEGISERIDNITGERNRRIETLDTDYDSYVRKVLSDNAKLKLMRSVLQNPATSRSILTPGGFQRIKDNNKAIIQAQKIKTTSDYLSPLTQVQMAARMNTGAMLIGISAVHNSVHAMLQHSKTNLLLNFPVAFNGVQNRMINITRDDKGSLVTRNFAEVLASGVDFGKDPQADFFNLNQHTASVVMMLLHSGVDLKTVQFFTGQPVVKGFIKEYANAGATRDAFNALVRKYKLEKVEGSSMLDTDSLEKNLNGKDRDYQKQVLRNFVYYFQRASATDKFIQAVKTGDRGPGITQAENAVKSMASENTDFAETIQGSAEFLKDMSLPGNKFIEIIRRSNEFIVTNAGFPDITQGPFRAMLENFEELKGNSLSASEVESIYRQFFDFIASGHEFYKWNPGLIEALPDRLTELKKSVSNPLVDRLQEVNGKIEFRAITGTDDAEAERIRNTWAEMYMGEHREFAADLARYAFYSNGFRFGRNGFSHLMPVELFEEIEGLNEFMMRQVDVVNNDFVSSTPFFHKFQYQYVLNNYPSLSWVRPVRYDNLVKNVKAVLFDSNKEPVVIRGTEVQMHGTGEFREYVPFIRYNYKGETYLFKYARGGVYERISPLALYQGKDRQFQMYDFNSFEPKNSLIPDVSTIEINEARKKLGEDSDFPDSAEDTPLNDKCNGLQNN